MRFECLMSIHIRGNRDIILDDTVESVNVFLKKRVLLVDKKKDIVNLSKILSVDMRVDMLSGFAKNTLIKDVVKGLGESEPAVYYNLRQMKELCDWLLKRIQTYNGLLYKPIRRYILIDLGCGGDTVSP